LSICQYLLVSLDPFITERFVRASGPGGQNVNKVATAVELRFDLAAAPIAEDVKARLKTLAGNRITSEGVLVIEAREHRTQARNRAAARERLDALLSQARQRPRKRRATRPSAGSREKRLEQKKRRAVIKQSRQRSDD
jgi:ribosome-associated protein